MNGTWFKNYQSDFLNGLAGLDSFETALYVRLIFMMYEADGPIKRNDRALAKMCAQRLPRYRKSLESLITSGKITSSDGMLFNDRTADEIAKRDSFRLKQSLNGVKSGISRRVKATKNNNKNNGSNKAAFELWRTRAVARDVDVDSEGRNPPGFLPEGRDTRADAASVGATAAPRARPRKPPTFEDFWAAYPLHDLDPKSREVTELCWDALEDFNQRRAIEQIRNIKFLGRPPPPPHTWLETRCWSEIWQRHPELSPYKKLTVNGDGDIPL